MKYAVFILSLVMMVYGAKRSGHAAWSWWKTLTGAGLFAAGYLLMVAVLMSAT